MGKGKRARDRRARDGGQAQGGYLRSLLGQELQRALFGDVSTTVSKEGSGGHPRGPQWRCPECHRLNDVGGRKKCRICGCAPPVQHHVGKNVKPDHRPIPPAGRTNPRPWGLEHIAAQARKAGASESAVTNLRQDAEKQKQARLDLKNARRSPGGTLDAASARLRKFTNDAEKAREDIKHLEQQLVSAKERAEAADAAVAKATLELDELKVNLTSSHDHLKILLEGLAPLAENGHMQLSASALEAFGALRGKFLDVAETSLTTRLEQPLDMEVQRRFGRKRFRKENTLNESADADVDNQEDALSIEDTEIDDSLDDLSVEELEKRLEATYIDHGRALDARDWKVAQELMLSVQSLTEALQKVSP